MLQRRLRSTPKSLTWLLALGTSFVVACGGGGTPATPSAVSAKPTVAVAGPTATRPALPTSSPQALPKSSPVVAAKPSPSPGQEYTVAEGDTMARIAQQFYNDPTLWRRIYDANKDAIGDDPDRIKVGTKVTIPPKPQ